MQRETLAGGVDMVICTPGRFNEHLAAGNCNLDAAKGVVLDEVDVLMGRCSFLTFLSASGFSCLFLLDAKY